MLAKQIMDERRAAGFPPYTHLALLRAEAKTQVAVDDFLSAAAKLINNPIDHLQLLGPMPAPMPRRAGQIRAQLLLLAEQRAVLHGVLSEWMSSVRELPQIKQVRWSLDVDAVDLY